ncbi:MAG: hypothetical protein ACRD0U_12950 [Acidimicrobiales bacterium]
MRRYLLVPILAPALLLTLSGPAGACGALVGENGTIQLVRTTTLAAYHAGVEHYVTSFEFTGEGEQIGSIIPLPDVPTTVERGGEWTLQRLAREVAPAERASGDLAASAADGASAEVILETKIDALEITVLRGGADEVGEWALDHGFFLSPDAPEMLEFYAERSPIFMAARFDAATARDLGQNAGDGTPIHLTIPTDDAWVPLRILSLGLDTTQVVDADVFLLTDDRPRLATGGPGLSLARSESASDLLLDDLRSDAGMEWVPESMWLTYLQLSAPAGDLDYDLGVSTNRLRSPSLTDVGVQTREVRTVDTSETFPWVPVSAAVLAIAVLAAALTSSVRRRPA